jgi:hypothetical protein
MTPSLSTNKERPIWPAKGTELGPLSKRSTHSGAIEHTKSCGLYERAVWQVNAARTLGRQTGAGVALTATRNRGFPVKYR